MSFKKGLMEFAEGFVLSAGTTIAENIKEKAKQDRADILATTKELKTRIQKNKTADRAASQKYRDSANKIFAVAPGLRNVPELTRELLASPDYATAFIDRANADTNKTGTWFNKQFIDKFGLKDDFDIYKVPETAPTTSSIVKQLRFGDTLNEKAIKEEQESNDTEEAIRTILGAGMGAEEIIKTAEGRLRGQGATRFDIDRFGGAGYIPSTIRSRGAAVPIQTPPKVPQTYEIAALTATSDISKIIAGNKSNKGITDKQVISHINRGPLRQIINAYVADPRNMGADSFRSGKPGNVMVEYMPIDPNTNKPIKRTVPRHVYLSKNTAFKNNKDAFLTNYDILLTYQEQFINNVQRLNTISKRVGQQASLGLTNNPPIIGALIPPP